MSKRMKADIILISIAIVWGASYPITSNMLIYMDSFTVLFLRCIAAVPILIAVFFKRLLKVDSGLIKCGTIIGVLMSAGMAMLLYGLSLTTSLNTTLIVGLTSPLTALFSSILLKERPEKGTIVGIVMCFTGVYFIGGGLEFKLNIGDILVFLSDFFFVMQTILIDKYNKKYEAGLLGTIQIISGSIVAFFIWIISGSRHIVINSVTLFGIIFTGIFGLGLAFTFQAIAQKHTSPTHTDILLGSEPMFGLLFSLIIPTSLGIIEKLSFGKATGAILIFLGIVISEMKFIRKSLDEEYKFISD